MNSSYVTQFYSIYKNSQSQMILGERQVQHGQVANVPQG